MTENPDDTSQKESNPASDVKKGLHERYDGRLLWTWARDPMSFKSQIPTYLARLSYAEYRDPPFESEVHRTLFDQTRKKIDDFFVRGQLVLMETIYGRWAYRKSYVENEPTYQILVPIGIDSLKPNQHHEWELYRDLEDVPRPDAILAVRNLIGLIEPPYHRYMSTAVLEVMFDAMGRSQCSIVSAVFPDVTADEVHGFFGQAATVEDVLAHRSFGHYGNLTGGSGLVGGSALGAPKQSAMAMFEAMK